MNSSPFCRGVLATILIVMPAMPMALAAQGSVGTTLEQVEPPGNNYDKAEFRLWLPEGGSALTGLVVLVPGSNGDGRSMVEDSVWRAFAARHHMALVGCRFTDKPHEQGFIEEYINVSRGSGQALLDALAHLGTAAKHPELATAPMFLWGMSAGGEFDYEFAAWKPERVIAFVVNKGGIYYTALASHAARNVPGMLFVGGKDLEFRTNTIAGIFAVNRRGGALWALAEEPGVAHVVGRSRDLGAIFFEDVLPLRLGAAGELKTLTEKSGFIGDLKAKTFGPSGAAPTVPTAWLPTERVARAWVAMLTEKPFDQ